MQRRLLTAACIIGLGMNIAGALAQDPATGQTEQLTATATLVQGRIFQAPAGTESTDRDAWKPVAQGDELSSGTQIRVSLRSTLVLMYGDDTLIQLKSATLASLDELYKTENTKTSRIGLAYGAVRGSVREKELQSDMIIDSPTVTCSKEGTENFEIRVMRGSRAWWADGPTAGTILVRDQGTGRSERLSFSQISSFLTMTTPQAQRNLLAQVVDIYGSGNMSGGEQNFNLFQDGGASVLGPGLGSQASSSVPGRGALGQNRFAGLQGSDVVSQLLRQGTTLLFRNPESRFGTGPRLSNDAARRR